jgi:hypothetical protein
MVPPLAPAGLCLSARSLREQESSLHGVLQHLASLTLHLVTVPTTRLVPVGQAPNLVGRGQGVCRSQRFGDHLPQWEHQ